MVIRRLKALNQISIRSNISSSTAALDPFDFVECRDGVDAPAGFVHSAVEPIPW